VNLSKSQLQKVHGVRRDFFLWTPCTLLMIILFQEFLLFVRARKLSLWLLLGDAVDVSAAEQNLAGGDADDPAV
jgi:hypothetical protein